MKKILICIGLFSFVNSQAQILTEATPSKENAGNFFLEASAYGDESAYQTSIGRGLIFPRTNLKEFSFDTTGAFSFGAYYSCYDGMVVYNTATGKTGSNPATQGQQVDVEPGFYYFSNPGINGQDDVCSVENGHWIRIGDAAASSSSSNTVDYKLGDAQPTGEFFWPDNVEAHKKPIMRKTIEVQFDNVTYADVTGMVPKDARFIKTQLVDKTTGKMLLASAEFKPNGGAEFGVTHTNDFFVAKYGQMSTTLSGTYTMILEYYVPN